MHRDRADRPPGKPVAGSVGRPFLAPFHRQPATVTEEDVLIACSQRHDLVQLVDARIVVEREPVVAVRDEKVRVEPVEREPPGNPCDGVSIRHRSDALGFADGARVLRRLQQARLDRQVLGDRPVECQSVVVGRVVGPTPEDTPTESLVVDTDHVRLLDIDQQHEHSDLVIDHVVDIALERFLVHRDTIAPRDDRQAEHEHAAGHRIVELDAERALLGEELLGEVGLENPGLREDLGAVLDVRGVIDRVERHAVEANLNEERFDYYALAAEVVESIPDGIENRVLFRVDCDPHVSGDRI